MNGEPQLIAEAIAAAMHNREQFRKSKRRDNNHSTAQTTTMMSSASMSNVTFSLIEVVHRIIFLF